MGELRQIVLDGQEENGLFTGETAQIRLRGIPKIRILRGKDYFTPYSDSAENTASELGSSAVFCPVPKAVVALLKKLNRRPEPASLAQIEIDASEVQGQSAPVKATLKAGSVTKEIPLELKGNVWVSEKFVLLTYGDGSADAAPFEDVLAIDISKGDAVGFEVEGTLEVGTHKRKFGCLDVQLKDSDDGKFRSIRFGIFKDRASGIKLICPQIGANNLRVLLDDGQNETPDQLDITRFLNPAGAVTDKAAMPKAVNPEENAITGTWTSPTPRTRIYDDPEQESQFLGMLLLGENRILIQDTSSGETVYEAHFLIYEDDEDIVVGWNYGMDETKEGEKVIDISANHVLLDFKDGTKWKELSQTLHALHLIPQGIAPQYRIVQASTAIYVAGNALASYVAFANEAHLPGIESFGLDVATGGPEVVTEKLAEAFRRDFTAGNHSFTNAATDYFHHFYIHTFPAHRLIDHIRFGTTAPPSVILEGSHFLNKTFILPSCKPSVRAALQAQSDNPSRKMAIFGHADASGEDAHNTTLSQFRAEIAHALLIKNPDTWLTRIDGTPLIVETPWGTSELQFMLKHLDFYQGPVNGVSDPSTRAASRKFLQKKGLPDNGSGQLNRAARRQLISDYMDDLVPTPLQATDFHRDGAGQPALFAAGEAFPLIPSDPTNAQNRRITFVLRTAPPLPVDITQRGALAPYPAWIAPEPDAPAQGGDNPPVAVGCWDSGFGHNDDFSGDRRDISNRLFVRGRRLVRPTLIGDSGVTTHRVFRDGDLSGTIVGKNASNFLFVQLSPAQNLVMTDEATPHGTSVMTTMAADGVGDEIGGASRNARQVVLGTGKDVKFRPVKSFSGTSDTDFLGSLARYRIMQNDPEVKVVSTSFDVRFFDTLSVNQQNAIRQAARTMVTAGKLFFLAAANVQTSPSQLARRDVLHTESGNHAPRRAQKRSSLTGNNLYRRSVMAVGASTQALSGAAHTSGITEFPTSFTFLGDEVSIAMPGQNVRALQSTTTTPNAVTIAPISGTSFSTPMTAGVAAEMMLANPILQQGANMPRIIEMLEATADLLPSLALAPAAQRGRYLPGAAVNPDPQLVPSDLAGFRRVHFWKAVLAAVNDGLPSEQRIPNPAGGANILATAHFDQLTGRDHAATTWYGFEIRSPIADAQIYFKRADGSFLPVEDGAAALPQANRRATTWARAQDLRMPAGPLAGTLLPNFPFTVAANGVTLWFLCQFSAKREELARYSRLCIYPNTIDPSNPLFARAPTLSFMPLDQITRMRNKAGITGPEATGNADLAQIVAHVEEFDDFVFHWTIRPQALHHFVLVHGEGASVAEDLTVTLFAADAMGNLKTDFNGNVNIGHNGTAGALVGVNSTGVHINGNIAGASTAIAVANGMATFTVRNHTVENFRLTATDGAGHNDDSASPIIHVGPPGPLGGLRVEVTHFNGASVTATPPRVGDRLKFTVTVLDTHDRVKTNFTGQVDLRVIEGQMGQEGANPPATKRGVHVADAQADAFDIQKFKHNFVAGDRGKFEFSVFVYTAGATKLQAVREAVSGESSSLNLLPGALHHFDITGVNAIAAGANVNYEVRARDAFGNLKHDYSNRVLISTQPGAMAGSGVGGANRGVFFNNQPSNPNDHLDFSDADRGVKPLALVAYTAGNFQIRAVQGGVTSDSAAITVNAPAAVTAFGFEVGPNQNRGVSFPVTVIPRDTGGNRVPNFAGNVTLSVVSGPASTIAVNSHAFIAADNGQFTFFVRPNNIGTLVLRALSGAVNTPTAAITIS